MLTKSSGRCYDLSDLDAIERDVVARISRDRAHPPGIADLRMALREEY
jgi:hypothetical protein